MARSSLGQSPTRLGGWGLAGSRSNATASTPTQRQPVRQASRPTPASPLTLLGSAPTFTRRRDLFRFRVLLLSRRMSHMSISRIRARWARGQAGRYLVGVQKTKSFLGLRLTTPRTIGRSLALRRAAYIGKRTVLRTVGRRFVICRVVFSRMGLVNSKVSKWERRFVTSWMNSWKRGSLTAARLST